MISHKSGLDMEARRWFVQAQADFEVVRLLRSAGYYAAACLHARQPAEKTLEAVLFIQGCRIGRLGALGARTVQAMRGARSRLCRCGR